MFTFGPIGAAQLIPVIGTAAIVVGWGLTLICVRRRHRGHSAPPSPPLRITGLGHRFGRTIVLHDVSFELSGGQVLALLGPNGAGKTTLLRAIGGLLEPAAGSIQLFGQCVTPGAPVLSRVGLTIEEPGFAPHLTGRQNLTTLWAITGRPAGEAQFELAAQLAGLTPFLDHRASTYSQGQKQRLALAQALLGLPELLILDEPANGLDPAQTRELGAMLAHYARSGRTVLLASHHLAEIAGLCSHALVLNRGTVAWFSPVDSLPGPLSVTFGVVDPPTACAILTAPLAQLGIDPATAVTTSDRSISVALQGIPLPVVMRAAVDALSDQVSSVQTSDRLADLYESIARPADARDALQEQPR